MVKFNLNGMFSNLNILKSEFNTLIDLNKVNKGILNQETAVRLGICIKNLKSHLNDLNKIKDSYKQELYSLKSDKEKLLLSGIKTRGEYLKLKESLLKYDDGKDLTLIEKMTCSDLNYIEYKSLLKTYNLFLKELKANEKILRDYQSSYIKCVETRNNFVSKLSPALKSSLEECESIESILNLVNECKLDLGIIKSNPSLLSQSKIDVVSGLYNKVKDDLNLKFDIKKLLSIDDNLPKILKELLLITNKILTKDDILCNIKLLKEQLTLIIEIGNFKVLKTLTDGVNKIKILNMYTNEVIYTSDLNEWSNDNERKEFYFNTLDFIEMN